MTPCDNLGAFADGELPLEDANQFRAHLATCDACGFGLEEHVTMVARLSTLPPMPWHARARRTLKRTWRRMWRAVRRAGRFCRWLWFPRT